MSPPSPALTLAVVLTAVAAPIFGGLAVEAAPAVRLVDPADPSAHATIAAGIASAVAGDRVVVRPGTYAETVTTTKSITLCSTGPLGTDCDPRPDLVTISSAGSHGISITANGATVEGFTVRVTGSGTLNGILVTGSGARIARNIVTAPTSGDGSFLPGESGIAGRLVGSIVEENEVTGWKQGVYLRPYGSTTTVRDNALRLNGEGVLVYSPTSRLEGNSFERSVLRAIGVGVISAGASVPHGIVLRDNRFVANPMNIAFRTPDGPPTPVLVVDAKENHWGAYSQAAIQLTIDPGPTSSSVVVDCFYDVDGATKVCPPDAAFAVTPDSPTWRQEARFRDASTPHGRPVVAWRWDFGDGATSAEPSPAHAFATPGPRTVTLTVTDQEGYENTTSRSILVVNAAPVLSVLGERTVAAGRTLALRLQATDADGDSVAYNETGLPPGATLDRTSGDVRWIPSAAQVGAHPVTFGAWDGASESTVPVVLTVTAEGNPRLAVDALAPVARSGSPGATSSFTFRVRNFGAASEAVHLAPVLPAGWTAEATPADLALAPGESAEISLAVVPAAGGVAGNVGLAATSTTGGRAHGFATLWLPVTVTLEVGPSYGFDEAVAGRVVGTYLDGSAASGVGIALTEQSLTFGSAAGTRRTALVLGSDGAAAFALPVDLLGANLPGEHRVVARALGSAGSGAVATRTYEIG